VTFRLSRRVHHLVGGPYVGCRGRFVWFGCHCDRSGREPDSSALIVDLTSHPGTRASLFRNSVGRRFVSDPCFENVRMDTTLRNVCMSRRGRNRRLATRAKGATNDAGPSRDRRRLPGRAPGQPGRRAGRVHLLGLAVPDHPGRLGAAVGQGGARRRGGGGPGADPQRLGAAGRLAAGSWRQGGAGAAGAVGRPARLLQQAHQDRPARLEDAGPPAAAAPRRPARDRRPGPGRCASTPWSSCWARRGPTWWAPATTPRRPWPCWGATRIRWRSKSSAANA